MSRPRRQRPHDGSRVGLVVYGLGRDAEAAEAEARAEYEGLGWRWDGCVLVDLTRSQARRVRAGVVAARDLGVEVSERQYRDLGEP